MKELLISPRFHQLAGVRYLRARPGGGKESQVFPLLGGHIAGLPPRIRGLIATSDLQGRTYDGRLLGLEVVRTLLDLSLRKVLPPLHDCLILVGGDLWVEEGAERRGGMGDILEVVQAFHMLTPHLVVVPGNHDLPFDHPRNGDRKGLGAGDLLVAGLGGVIGDPARPQRYEDKAFLGDLRAAIEADSDILLMHQGPTEDTDGRRVSAVLSEQGQWRGLVVHGHRHAGEPLSTRPGGGQTLNVEGRIVALTAERP